MRITEPTRARNAIFVASRRAAFAVLLGIGLLLAPTLVSDAASPTRAAWKVGGTSREATVSSYDGGMVARRVIIRGATPREAAQIRDVISRIRYPLDPATFSVQVLTRQQAIDPNEDGWYSPPDHVVQIGRWALATDDRQAIAGLVAHEIGHMVDDRYLTTADRQRIAQLRGHPPGVDWLAPESPWRNRPVEDFAEVFRVLTQPVSAAPVQTSYGPVTSRRAVIQMMWPGVTRPWDDLSYVDAQRQALLVADRVRLVEQDTRLWVLYFLTTAAWVFEGTFAAAKGLRPGLLGAWADGRIPRDPAGAKACVLAGARWLRCRVVRETESTIIVEVERDVESRVEKGSPAVGVASASSARGGRHRRRRRPAA
jgi:hypothetical protein